MKYSPEKQGKWGRVIYCALLILSLLTMTLNSNNYIVTTIAKSISLVALALSLYLFIRFELYSYEYILLERNSSLDFYVNKLNGKRGSYVCYFPLIDCIEIDKYENAQDVKKALREKYSVIRFSNYLQNLIGATSAHYILFKNDASYDCIFFEPSEEMVRLIKGFISKSGDRQGEESTSNGEIYDPTAQNNE